MKHYNPFQFKQFTIEHNHAAMKVGTDSILLGAWATVHENERILDIGTGTALLSIMLAQRVNGNCQIDAVEIDQGAIRDATINIQQCPWGKSIELHPVDFMKFNNNETYHLIVSNPPFYEGASSPSLSRNIARNANTSIKFDALLHKASGMLKPEGRLSMIVPFEITKRLIKVASINGLKVAKQVNIRPRYGKEFNRSLIEFCKTQLIIDPVVSEFSIREAQGEAYTEEYKRLTGAFYL